MGVILGGNFLCWWFSIHSGGNFSGGGFLGWELSRWEFSGWESSWVGVVQVVLIPGGNFLWWKFTRWELSGGNHPGGNFPGGSFHVTKSSSHLGGILAKSSEIPPRRAVLLLI